ncbi:AraC family transcriptional regulator [Anaerotalea alkaliphila]|uniref:AraC family transcriptional regulator n=1 Tax=Anaerotalea alkaliphila TaxID=2662126 RepID=A0A7X5HU29_9FIRM|nr:AraC family transcriptional regulator [Anaerotalea alkaliphila]NDL66680.1 AraC family transcriptional regulator [Anaerotalea alkaliphila]
MKEFNYEYSRPSSNMALKQYIYRIGSYHFNWHKEIELLLVLRGEVEVCGNGVSRVLEADDLIVINANVGHASLAHEPDSIAMVLHVDPVFLKEYYEKIEFLSFNCFSMGDTRDTMAFQSIRASLAEMMLTGNQEESEKRLHFKSALYSLLHTIVSNFPPQEIQAATFVANQKNLDAINGMIRYINKNYRKKITLEKLANESGYNPSYVSQLFKAHLGINYYDYLTRIRLREATVELGKSNASILEIALSNGFPDIKAFNTAFKENFRKSPKEYRSRLNSENAMVDVNFKREFISTEDGYVNKKLEEYISVRKGDFSSTACLNEELRRDQAIQSNRQLAEMASKLRELAQELDAMVGTEDESTQNR